MPATSATLTDNEGLNSSTASGNGNVYQFQNVRLSNGLVITISQMQTIVPASLPFGRPSMRSSP